MKNVKAKDRWFEKYFLEIERWDIRMHLLYCLTFKMFMVINKFRYEKCKGEGQMIWKIFLGNREVGYKNAFIIMFNF